MVDLNAYVLKIIDLIEIKSSRGIKFKDGTRNRCKPTNYR